MLLLNAKREGYSPEQCRKTMTVGELIRELKCFDPEERIYLSHDSGYTYGSISDSDLEEQEAETENEDEDESEEQGMEGQVEIS